MGLIAMVGNAAEEGLLGQLHNPSHTDRGRIVVPASIVSGLVTGLLIWKYAPFLNTVAGTLVCIIVAWRLAIWFERRDWAQRSAEREAKRAAEIAESERQIQAMKDAK